MSRLRVVRNEGTDEQVVGLRDGQAGHQWHFIAKHLSFSVWESADPGTWVLTCDAARFDREDFPAKPHDAEDVLRVAAGLVGERLKWLAKRQEMELAEIQKVITTILEEASENSAATST